MFGPPSPGHSSACSVHHQYSSSVSPFQANTGTPRGLSTVPSGPTATAAAAWSWVEKMLQLAQRTRAPSAVNVSINTAVCTVMCNDPVMRAPARGWLAAYSERMAIRPGISCSARTISLRPNSAAVRSATLKGRVVSSSGHGISFFGSDISCAGARPRFGPYGGSASHVLRPLSEAVYPSHRIRPGGWVWG